MATTLDPDPETRRRALDAAENELALVVAFCASEPDRVGETLRPEAIDVPHTFGRAADGRDATLRLRRERPGRNELAAPLRDPFMSRAQLELRWERNAIFARNAGRRGLLVDGARVDEAWLEPGSVIEIEGRMVFLCTRRPQRMRPAAHTSDKHVFGRPDAQGIVGESPAAWALRERIAFCAARGAHVLVLGSSGVGKELVAQALHSLSQRAGRRLVARNAATFPAGLIEAELFGNVAGYPNPGTPDRPGLLGEADGSTLFLDEIGELGPDLQARLLRVLDAGEYQRLGESRRRCADVRVVGATNRAIEELKHDVAARFSLRLAVPGLEERREDVPLLAKHLLCRMVAEDASLARFLDAWDGARGEPRVTPAFVTALLRRTFTTHTREIEAMLYAAMMDGEPPLDAPPPPTKREQPVDRAQHARREVGPDELLATLERTAWVQERAWKELALPNRFVLQRLMRKYGIARPGPGAPVS